MKPRILFVINSLHTGGAERVLARLLDFGSQRATTLEPHVALLDDQPQMRALPAGVPIHILDGRGQFLRSLWQLRRLARDLRPALAVSLLVRANTVTALAMRGLPGKALLCERMHLTSHLSGRYTGIKLAGARLLPRLTYRLADGMLAVSQGVRADLIARHGLAPDKVRTIHNPYDIDAINREGAEIPAIPLPPRFLLGVGRLVAAKNFAMLIDAYAAAQPAQPLVILGEGEEREQLERQVARLGLAGRVVLPGFVANPYSVMARAQWLLSASRNEGFPNVVAEAMALGCPVAITDCPSGPADLLGGPATMTGGVTHAPFGLIMPTDDKAAMVAAIGLTGDAALRAHYAARGKERLQDFRAEIIAAAYWDIFEVMALDRASREQDG